MNNMKQMIHSKFSNLGVKLRLDKNSDSDSLALPTYAEVLYMSSKNDKEVYNELYKKMSTICLQNYSTSDDKKMKKNSWESLSMLLSESEKKLSDDILTKDVLASSIRALDEMARNTKDFEKILSANIIKHFHDLSEDNTLANTKKCLTSLSKDLKANTDKVQSLQDQLSTPTSDILLYRRSAEITSPASMENKLASAQIVEENTEKEWENKKDLYLTKLFAAEAEKFTTAEKILEFFQDYLDYYIECQKTLSTFIPEIKASLDRNRNNFAFHVALEDHLTATNRKLSYVLETCIQELDNEDTLQHEGLFRISGGKNKIELLKNALNVMRVDDFVTKGLDSAVFAGVLKQYLRELPIPLMTYELYDSWCEVGIRIRQNDIDGSLASIKNCLSLMPRCYYDNLAYLMQFLKKITLNESVNKMSASNLGLMLGPNLIRNNHSADSDDSDTSVMLMLGSPGGSVLEFMIVHFTDLFPDAPVYPTAPKRAAIKVPELSYNSGPSDTECERNARKMKNTNDTDSVLSADLLTDDSLSTASAEPGDQMLKSPRDAPVNQRSLRKAPLPPSTKPYVIENETDMFNDGLLLRGDNRPTVTKRMSKLEKHSSDPINDIASNDTVVESQTRRVTSTQLSPRPPPFTITPTIPTKKPINTVSTSSSECIDKPTRPENPPPKRPNMPPPPPVPSFDKLKENLDHKHEEKKQNVDNDEYILATKNSPATVVTHTSL